MVVRLENENIRLVIRPDFGGRIDDLIDIKRRKNWLWHPEGYTGSSRRLSIGAPFEELWTGGWDELFPNDAEAKFRGYDLADHGELWSQPWTLSVQTETAVTMSYRCKTVPVDVMKTVSIDPEQARLTVRYAFDSRKHEQKEPLPFLFKMHAAIAIEAGDEILLPPCTIEPVKPDFGTVIGRMEKTRWPNALNNNGEEIDVSRVPARESNGQEFVYATSLQEGWCGIRNPKTGAVMKFRYDLQEFPFVWLFQSFGKWRGQYVLVMEPATTIPYDLELAHRQGTCAVLQPGERRNYSISLELNGV